MTLAICTPATDGMQDSATDAPEEAFLDPAVDTSQKRVLGCSVESLYFSSICRTFISGGTRIRTGDTMIFSHFRRPIGMRKTRIGTRIYVRRVPVGTSWFCPYCCATVDTVFVILQRHRRLDTCTRSRDSSVGLLWPLASPRFPVGAQPQSDVGGLHSLAHHLLHIVAQGV